ncbi:MAG: hypothetical protein ABJ364_08215, partial [Lentilitoribacter sp.]
MMYISTANRKRFLRIAGVRRVEKPITTSLSLARLAIISEDNANARRCGFRGFRFSFIHKKQSTLKTIQFEPKKIKNHHSRKVITVSSERAQN